MGNPKQKWTSEEEEALRAGVAKHGTGKWKNIQKDPEFNHFLYSRSNIDLKDKWRNMSVSANGQGPREKSRTPKTKANLDTPATPLPIVKTTASTTPVANDTPADAVMDDSSKCLLDRNIASNTMDRGDAATRPAEEMQLDGRARSTSTAYNGLIYEALSALKDPNGSDTNAIVSFIEQKQEVLPPNFRRLLSSRLRRLVAQDKLEKIQNCYKIKRDVLVGAKTPTPKPKDVRPKQSPTTGYLGDTIEEAAVAAAYKVAEAENKSFVAAEAVKEAERVSKMAEDADSLLQLAKEIFEKCSRGEIVLIA